MVPATAREAAGGPGGRLWPRSLGARRGPPTYDRPVGLFLRILPFLLIALLVLIPTRRLFLAGWPRSYLLTYFVVVVGLGGIVAELEVAARYLVPILVIAYIAPFVTAGAGIARLIGRRAGGGQAGDIRPVVRRVEPTALPPRVGSARRFTGDVAVDDDRAAPGTDTSGGHVDAPPEDRARPGWPSESDSKPESAGGATGGGTAGSHEPDEATRR